MSTETLNNARIRSEASSGSGCGNGSSLAERGRALENAYFAKRDRELIDALKFKKCGSCKCSSDCDKDESCSKAS